MANAETDRAGLRAQPKLQSLGSPLVQQLEASEDPISARLAQNISIELRSRSADLKQLFRGDAERVANRLVAEGLIAAACGIGNIPGPWSYALHPQFLAEADRLALQPEGAKGEAEIGLQVRARRFMAEHPEEAACYLISAMKGDPGLAGEVESRFSSQLRRAFNAAFADPETYSIKGRAPSHDDDLHSENLCAERLPRPFIRAVDDGRILVPVDRTARLVSGISRGKQKR